MSYDVESNEINSWTTMQAHIALIAGKAELCALLKGALHASYLLSLALVFDINLKAPNRSDSPAAMGITS